MYKSPSRNHRSKGGIKLKHILQICILGAVCFWLIYQVKRSHEKKQEFDEKDRRLVGEKETGSEMLKLGRKDVARVVDMVGEDGKMNGEDEEENEAEEEESKHEGDEKEGEQNKVRGREEEEDEEISRGGGGIDDEIDEREQEKAVGETESEGEVEEKEPEEKGEENENEEREEKILENEEAGEKEESHGDKGTETEDKDNETHDEDTHEAREENYKADDASSEVTHEAVNSTLEHTNDILQLNTSGVGILTQSSGHEGEVTEKLSNSTYTDELKNKDSPFVFEDTSSENSTTLGESQLEKKLVSDASQNSTNGGQSQLRSEKSQNATVLPDETHIPSNVTDAQITTGEAKPVDEGSSLHIQMVTQTNSSELASGEEQLKNKKIDSNSSNTEDVKLDNSEKTSNEEDHVEESIKTGNGESSDESQGAEQEENGGANGDLEAFEFRSEKENGGTIEELEGFESQSEKENGGTNGDGDLEGFESQSEKENADPEQHDDPIDDSDSALTQEEKDTRTDLETLPDITTEGQSTEVSESE